MPRGSKPGERRGGRRKGSRNKKTLARLKAERLAAERDILMNAARDRADQAEAGSKKLMVEIGFDLTQRATALAIFYAPAPTWHVDKRTKEPKNDNPHYDEQRFRFYAKMAMDGARDFSGYETPKLQAILLQAQTSNTVRMEGGLPDDQDGNLKRIDGPTAERDKLPPAGGDADHPAADLSFESGGSVSSPGPVQGDPLRKAVG